MIIILKIRIINLNLEYDEFSSIVGGVMASWEQRKPFELVEENEKNLIIR